MQKTTNLEQQIILKSWEYFNIFSLKLKLLRSKLEYSNRKNIKNQLKTQFGANQNLNNRERFVAVWWNSQKVLIRNGWQPQPIGFLLIPFLFVEPPRTSPPLCVYVTTKNEQSTWSVAAPPLKIRSTSRDDVDRTPSASSETN